MILLILVCTSLSFSSSYIIFPSSSCPFEKYIFGDASFANSGSCNSQNKSIQLNETICSEYNLEYSDNRIATAVAIIALNKIGFDADKSQTEYYY